MTVSRIRAALAALPANPPLQVFETPAGPAILLNGDQDAIFQTDARLSSALACDQRPVGYALSDSEVQDASERVRSGELTLVRPVPGSSALVEVSSRRLEGVEWVRVVRSPLGAHTRGSVNVYIVDTGEGVVLVDAGFSTEAKRLRTALAIAGIQPGEVRAVFVTHCHADHIGGVAELQSHGWLSADPGLVLHRDTDRLGREMFLGSGERFVAHLLDNGIAEEDVPEWRAGLEAMGELANWPEKALLVEDGARFAIGDVTFVVTSTPGHSPDHVAIRASHHRHGDVVFLGDMTQGSRMPQCGMRDWETEDPIEDMRRSWSRLVEDGPAIGLPGHGAPIPDLAAYRAMFEALYEQQREDFCNRHGGRELCATDILLQQIRREADFGPKQFVFYGAVAWLKHLERRGLATRTGEHPHRYLVEAP